MLPPLKGVTIAVYVPVNMILTGRKVDDATPFCQINQDAIALEV
jgi:hypothetical protein